jgi:hypothetical protein
MEFISDFKLLPLPYYDIILGIDWLETQSPMRIDWLNKWMCLNVNGNSIQLHGVQPSLPEFSLVELVLVSAVEPVVPQHVMPEPIQLLLQSFANLFKEPKSLPPRRSCNHIIPLIPSAQPVYIRPYQFFPA